MNTKRLKINLQLFAGEPTEQSQEPISEYDDAIASTLAQMQEQIDAEKARADKAENQVIQLTKLMRNQAVNTVTKDEPKPETFNDVKNRFYK